MNPQICGTGFQQLKEAVATSAFHNSHERFDPPKCHPGTRTAVIERIMAWIRTARDHGDDEPAQKLIMWLNGKAGAGKSAIAQNIAEECEAEGLLLASFFFNRSDATRNHGRSLIPTIAYQMTSVLPETRSHLEDTINRDPLIFTRSIKAQMVSLIVRPIQELVTIPATHLIIIDGLDECNDVKAQEQILNVIAETLRQHRLPLVFLVASRPEPHITDMLNSFKFSDINIGLELNNSFNPDADICLFLQESFNKIRITHRWRSTIPNPWPTTDILDTLVRKSSGQFIYASVVIKFINSPRHQSASRLDIILGLRPATHDKPFAELDVLYMHIFQSLEDINTALMILTFLCLRNRDSLGLITRLSPNIPSISKFLDLEPQLVQVCISDLSSLLTVNEDNNLHISHASLEDFLFDPIRSGCFYIDKGLGHAMIAKQCLKHIASSQYDTVDNVLAYSCFIFAYHCKIATMTQDMIDRLSKFCSYFIHKKEHWQYSVDFLDFLHWMQSQTWEGSQEAYTQISSKYYQAVRIESQKYYAQPQTTLLITMMVENQTEFLNFWFPYEILACLFGLYPHKQTHSGPVHFGVEEDSLDLSYHLCHSDPKFTTTVQVLEETLDRKKYSVALLMLFQYLCDSHPHNWARSSHGVFRCNIRRTQPWKWQGMCKPRGPLQRSRQYKEADEKRWQQWYQRRRCFNREPQALSAMGKLWEIKAYCLALRLVERLLHRARTFTGDYDPELVAFARRRAFSFTAMKLPRHKKRAEAAIARFLAEVDREENR